MVAWSPAHIGKMFGVSRHAVIHWMKKCRLPFVKVPVCGHRRVDPEVLAEWCYKIQRPDLAQTVLSEMARRAQNR